jgi:Sulfotransferase domain
MVSPVKRLPEFLIVGAQKAATTSLWAYLRAHPEIFMPAMKEPNFFIREGNWSLGLDWYRSLFEAAREHEVTGEASPGYSAFPIFDGAPARIATTVPQAKIIYLIREPVERMISSWFQSRCDALEDRPLHESLLLQRKYVDLSRYATQIERYLECFDRNSILILRAEDLSADPAGTVDRACRFIGVEPGRITGDLGVRHNVSSGRLVARRGMLILRGLPTGPLRVTVRSRVISRRSRLTHRPLRPRELTISDELRETLRDDLVPEMQRLRSIVGPEMDLWGYA